jgi:hypothetical protein
MPPQNQIEPPTTLYVVAIVALCALTVAAVVVISIMRPEQDNAGVIAIIIGITLPTSTALMAKVQQQMHLAMNSRMTQFLELTATASKAEGKLEEQAGVAASGKLQKDTTP